VRAGLSLPVDRKLIQVMAFASRAPALLLFLLCFFPSWGTASINKLRPDLGCGDSTLANGVDISIGVVSGSLTASCRMALMRYFNFCRIDFAKTSTIVDTMSPFGISSACC
jgi:hypothetical protein